MKPFEEEREELWASVYQLKRLRCLPAIREARHMLIAWLKQHPQDYATREVHHELVRLEGALEIIEEQKAKEQEAEEQTAAELVSA